MHNIKINTHSYNHSRGSVLHTPSTFFSNKLTRLLHETVHGIAVRTSGMMADGELKGFQGKAPSSKSIVRVLSLSIHTSER